MADTIKDGTGKLYYDDAYATDFEARVISCREKTDGKQPAGKQQKSSGPVYEIILDQTMFFPEEGGQSPDLGTLNGTAVTDVQIRDGVISHMTGKAFEEGSTVRGAVDRRHRFSNMQQHSGEHLFSGLVHQKFGYDNVGFHLSDREVTLDFNGPITDEQILEIEHQANEAIFANLETQILYPTKEEEKQIEYRSKIEIEGQTRLVRFPGIDVCACCAPHVRRTGEIGILKVVSLQNYKGGVRVSILCGKRALQLFDREHGSLSAISNYLTTSADLAYDSVVKLKEENGRQKSALARVASSEMERTVAEVSPDLKNVCLFTDGADGKAVRDAVNSLVEKHEGICAFFNGNDSDGYSFIIGSRTCDSREAGRILTEKFGARGGGKPAMIQGSVKASAEAIRTALVEVSAG